MFAVQGTGFSLVGAFDSGLEALLTATASGAGLAALLEGIDRKGLSHSDRVVLLQARARLLAHDQAELYADMVAVGDAVADGLGGHDLECEADEIGCALLLTRRTAENEMALARVVVERYPRLWQALWSGHLDLARVRIIVDGVAGLNRQVAVELIDRLVSEAGGLTTGQLRARLAKMVMVADPDGATARYEEAVKERRLCAVPNPDATAGLYGLDLPADRVALAMNRIHCLARESKTAGDARTADQIRADVFLDLLCGERADVKGGGRAVVDLRVDLTTLAGLNENPAEIPGWGPILADIARKVAAAQTDATWQVTVTGREGEVVWAGTTRRRPQAGLRRYLQASRPTCVFRGCRMPARQSDLDHNQAWSEGGPTNPDNLAPLCRRHHQTKHRAGWKLKQTRPGIWTWTSPLGRIYRVVAGPP